MDAITYTSPALIPKLEADPRFRIYYQTAPDLARAIYWRDDHLLFRDPRVRRALTLAINRRELLRALNLPDNIPVFDGPLTPRQLRAASFPSHCHMILPGRERYSMQLAGAFGIKMGCGSEMGGSSTLPP